MLRTHDSTPPMASQIVEWIGRLLGTGLVALFVIFALGPNEEPPPLNVGTASLGVMLVGFLLAWWRGVAGGLVSLLGIGAFYIWNFSRTGMLAGGPVFPLCFVPGALLVVGWMMRKSRSEGRAI